ncbi:MAG TPA: HAMP domain-containing sensor histidine kinase [Candidatus Acidoferrales bacterium]|nr:HAMP domain-containing sensor histidine kinase [Candidatus Acidoferrales bacterium]
MTFRTKLFLVFLFTVLASVTAVAWGVTRYTRRAFEEMDAQRTEALVAQFHREFAQRGEEVAHRVENIADAEVTLKMAISLSQRNADLSLFVRDAIGAAQDQGLDYLEFVRSDGTLISSAQYPARVGYKNDWVTAPKDWSASPAFLRREELPNEITLSLTAVRSQPQVPNSLYVIGGRRLDKNFLASLVLPAGMRALLYENLEPGFFAASLTDSSGAVAEADKFEPLIEQMQKQPKQTVQTIHWSGDEADAESIHAMPLLGRNDELLGVLLVGSPRREMVLLLRRIQRIALAAGSAALLIGLLLTWWVSARITRPVEELAEGARAVAGGDWDVRMETGGRDEIGQLAAAFNDMTRTLAAQRERLVQSERVAAWRELARRLAHELRNPLFPLQLTLENLQRARALSPEQFNEVFREATATLKAELANLNTIVSRFSDFSKMPTPELQPVKVNEAVRSAVRLFEPQFSAVGKPAITPEFYLAESLPDIAADPDLLHRALQNLVLNALDAMPAGGTLTLRTSAQGDGVRIEVADSGQGLTPEECSRLFTPYYTSKQHGTGLGLAIVQSVVSDHGGTISVTSDPGHGTAFRMDLPQRSLKAATVPKKKEAAPKPARAGTPFGISGKEV